MFPATFCPGLFACFSPAEGHSLRCLVIAFAIVLNSGCRRDPESVPPVPVVQRPDESPAKNGLAHEMKPTNAALPRPPYDLNTYEGVVADIVAKLDAKSKAILRETKKEDLIQFHHGWGTGIRNEYKLWSNEALLKSCGKQRGKEGRVHPDDASMIILEGVWAVVNSQD